MSRGIAVVMLAASCAEYTVSLEQESEAPLPVTLSWAVDMPVGIVVTARAHPFRNGGELPSDTDVDFVVEDPSVLVLAPVVDDTDAADVWALSGVAPGTTTVWPTVSGHEATPISVIVTEQDPELDR
jgi:hypothetical protein